MSRVVASIGARVRVYLLLAITLVACASDSQAAFAMKGSEATVCNPGGTSTVGGSESTAEDAESGKSANKSCFDKFLWEQNGIDYFTPCSTGSGGSNGSNTAIADSNPAASNEKWRYPVDGATESDHYGTRGGDHHGVDLAAPEGTPIYAAHSGTVVRAGPASGFGNWIIIETEDKKYQTVYGHMWDNGVDVKVGQHVNAGDKIGEVGSNGQSSGPHLHFEVWEGGRFGGKHVDPEPFLDDSNRSGGGSTPAPDEKPQTQDSCCATADASSEAMGTPSLAGSDNAEKVWNFLISQGLTPEQAAGVMGNLAWESGDSTFNYATSSEELSGGGGYGLAQWTGGRRTQIEQAAQKEAERRTSAGQPTSRNEVLHDLGFQLNYLVQESKGRQQRDGSGNEWEGLKGETSIEDANRYWMYNFERPGHLAEDKRLALAKQYYQKYTGHSPSDAGGSDSAVSDKTSVCADSSDEEE